MASLTFKVDGIEGLLGKMDDDIPDELLEEMLNMQAETIASEQRKNARMLLNERGLSTGETERSITIKKAKRAGSSMSSRITFDGTRTDGKRAAEIAFINEYGVPGKEIKARYFIRKAIDDKGDEALDKAEKIFRNWQENK